MKEVCSHPQRSQQLAALAPAPKSQLCFRSSEELPSQRAGEFPPVLVLKCSMKLGSTGSQRSSLTLFLVRRRKAAEAQPAWHRAQRRWEAAGASGALLSRVLFGPIPKNLLKFKLLPYLSWFSWLTLHSPGMADLTARIIYCL